MATAHSRALARLMVSPRSPAALVDDRALGMIVYFSFLRYNLLMPGMETWAGFDNYYYFATQPSFWIALKNTLYLVLGLLSFT